MPKFSKPVDWFDTNQVSGWFKKTPSPIVPAYPGALYPPQIYEVKSISGSLGRLYKMGFLKRKRVPRPVVRKKDGKQFVRGWKYLYCISNQGWKYAWYLFLNNGEGKERRYSKRYRPLWDAPPAEISHSALDLLLTTDGAASELLEARIKKHEPPGLTVYKRFPRRFDKELIQNLFECRISQVRTGWQLEKKVRQLEFQKEITEQLERHNTSIKKSFDQYIELGKGQSGRVLLGLSIKYFREHNQNPWMAVDQSLTVAIKDGIYVIPLLKLLDSVFRELHKRGFK